MLQKVSYRQTVWPGQGAWSPM